MANKDLKTRKPIGSAIDINLYNALKKYSDETKIPVSKLLDMGIEMLLKKRGVI